MSVTFRPGMRSWILLLFVVVSIGGLMLLNGFLQNQQRQIEKDLSMLEITEQLRDIRFVNPQDSLKARQIVDTFSQTKGAMSFTLSRSRMYSSFFMLLIIVASIAVFMIVLSRITHPLKELQKATDEVRRGNFSVHLPETGLYEIKLLKSSFNTMGRELEATQKRLLVAEKEMIWKDLSRILAHEIKNPLTPIQLAIQRLEERLQTDPASVLGILPDSIAVIAQEVENLRLLAQDFSNYAKVAQARKEVIDPGQSITEICRSYQNDRKIVLELEPDHKINFDRTHFYQIVTNILQNAMDASEPDQPITISLTKERNFAVISIRDQGSGIEAEDLHRIFEPYFSKKNKGTGLGLALVKKLCELNGAIPRVKSKPGQGSEFILIIEEANA